MGNDKAGNGLEAAGCRSALGVSGGKRGTGCAGGIESFWRVQEEDGMIGGGGRLSLGLSVFGGHSRFSLISSLTESPVFCEATLELRGDPPTDWRRVCCSKRPMRFATL
jgi:hypothetical protein